jgi:methylthioribose-1-phosphate isomerase
MNALSQALPQDSLPIFPSAFTPSPIRRSRSSLGIDILDQTALPHALRWLPIATAGEAARAISGMQVRGAPLIGIVAAYAMALAMETDPSDITLASAAQMLAATRPTAVNLAWAVGRVRAVLAPLPPSERAVAAWREADAIFREDAQMTAAIGMAGLRLLRGLAEGGSRALSVMTHCNAGWLAASANGTALAPIYAAQASKFQVSVLVSETRPRGQGFLTAWELAQAGVPHALFADNAAGALLARGGIDAVLVGADRIAANGDVANKVGTLLKALAARQFGVPFYVAAPSSTFDPAAASGKGFCIEERSANELRLAQGIDGQGKLAEISLFPAGEAVENPAFDVTPAELITGFISEHGAFESAAQAFAP